MWWWGAALASTTAPWPCPSQDHQHPLPPPPPGPPQELRHANTLPPPPPPVPPQELRHTNTLALADIPAQSATFTVILALAQSKCEVECQGICFPSAQLMQQAGGGGPTSITYPHTL